MAGSVVYFALCISALFFVRGTRAYSIDCPKFWIPFRSPFREGCYRFIATPQTWDEAEANCQTLGSGLIPGMEGHLASLHCMCENNFVKQYVKSVYHGWKEGGAWDTDSTELLEEAIQIQVQIQMQSSKPNAHNALWMGFNNEGGELDRFVWSDSTEMTFISSAWHDNATNFNCGHMWLSREGWNDSSCSTKLPYMCNLAKVSKDEPNDSWLSEPSSLGDDLLPCLYQGKVLLHGETYQSSGCTSVLCDNSTTVISVKSCPATFCDSDQEMTFPGECCSVCQYDVPVYAVVPIGHVEGSYITAGRVNEISVDLRVKVNRRGTHAKGKTLWKVDMWASSSVDGSGKKIGFIEEVLTDEQASLNLVDPRNSGNSEERDKAYQFIIPDIDFSLDASDAACEDIRYLCASFAKADGPEQFPSRIPFEVYGVHNETDTTPNPDALVGCRPFTICHVAVESCINVDCPPTFCDAPLTVESECCEFCPYNVLVHDIELILPRYSTGYSRVTAGGVKQVNANLRMYLNENSQGAKGSMLWMVGMWASANKDGSGQKIGYIEQVLTDDQASQELMRPVVIEEFYFTIYGIEFRLDASDATSCNEIVYLCASLKKGTTAEPQPSHVPFTVVGVESEVDSTPTPSKLVVCRKFSACRNPDGVEVSLKNVN